MCVNYYIPLIVEIKGNWGGGGGQRRLVAGRGNRQDEGNAIDEKKI